MTNRILIVDDEPGIRFALRHYFAQRGFFVDCACTHKEARTLIALHEYSLAILDLHLTGRNEPAEGFELAELLKRHAPETAIIILTAVEAPEAEQRAAEMGVYSFLKKPARLAKVAEVVLDLVGELAPAV